MWSKKSHWFGSFFGFWLFCLQSIRANNQNFELFQLKLIPRLVSIQSKKFTVSCEQSWSIFSYLNSEYCKKLQSWQKRIPKQIYWMLKLSPRLVSIQCKKFAILIQAIWILQKTQNWQKRVPTQINWSPNYIFIKILFFFLNYFN